MTRNEAIQAVFLALYKARFSTRDTAKIMILLGLTLEERMEAVVGLTIDSGGTSPAGFEPAFRP